MRFEGDRQCLAYGLGHLSSGISYRLVLSAMCGICEPLAFLNSLARLLRVNSSNFGTPAEILIGHARLPGDTSQGHGLEEVWGWTKKGVKRLAT